MAEISLESIAPNASIQKQYRDAMYAMLDEMRQDIIKDVVKPYRNDLAMDGIIDWIGHVMDSLVSKWQKRLETLPNEVAADFVGKSKTHYDRRLQKLLRKRGFIVNFRNSKQVEEMTQIAIGENVALIKSVGSQYLDNVRAAVWRSVKDGYDAESLVKQLSHIDGVSERRVKNIARTEMAKANQMFEDLRAAELGIVDAYWLHSSAVKEPRPEHVKANMQRYKISEGIKFSDGYWKPSQNFGCKCRKRLIIEIPENMVDMQNRVL